MLKSRARIDFAMFTFAQSSGIDDTMVRLVGPDLSIRGVLDHGQGVQSLGGHRAAQGGAVCSSTRTRPARASARSTTS